MNALEGCNIGSMTYQTQDMYQTTAHMFDPQHFGPMSRDLYIFKARQQNLLLKKHINHSNPPATNYVILHIIFARPIF